MEDVLKQNKLHSLSATLTPTNLPFSASFLEQNNALLEQLDLPTRKDENWKYTNLNGIKKLSLDKGASNEVLENTSISSQAHKIVIKNGVVIDSNQAIEGVRTKWSDKNLPEVMGSGALDALNVLHCSAAIEIEFSQDGTTKEVELVFENTINTHSFPRIFITCKKGSKGTVILNYQGSSENASFSNVSSFVEVEENANLSIHKIHKNGLNAFDLQREYVSQGSNSTFTINTFCLSGKMTRNDLYIKVKGNNCETFMNGAYTLKGKSHCDNHTTVDHEVAHCYSKELYKGVVDDFATNVFNGKVFVRKDAQKINAFQSNANILLSETGTVNSKPELEIYADDVKCSHGSTTGQLDDEAVFYLRSRGLSEKAAKELLVKAFLGEVLEEIDHEEVRSYVEGQIELHFSK